MLQIPEERGHLFGDVTTTMLWIGGQITTFNIMHRLILPSLISMAVPLFVIMLTVKGNFDRAPYSIQDSGVLNVEKKVVFFTGIGALIFVPVFKTITHLPPFMGMLIGLSVLWILTELLNKNREQEAKITVTRALRKIDIPSILFFLGILVAVTALESTGMLSSLAKSLSDSVGNLKTIAMSLGILSSVIDNVPLMAATMGIEQVDFFWYMKRITPAALLGYLAGALVYILLLDF